MVFPFSSSVFILSPLDAMNVFFSYPETAPVSAVNVSGSVNVLYISDCQQLLIMLMFLNTLNPVVNVGSPSMFAADTVVVSLDVPPLMHFMTLVPDSSLRTKVSPEGYEM